MNKRIRTAALAGIALAVASPALGAEVCGMDAKDMNGVMMVQAGSLEATCAKQSLCTIQLSKAGGMTFAIERASLDGSWLALVTSPSQIDSGAGIDLVFNGDDETRVAPDFIIAAEDMKSIRVDDDVSQIVVSTMLESNSMQAVVQLVGGEKVTHEVGLTDLAKAVDWVDCAQAQ